VGSDKLNRVAEVLIQRLEDKGLLARREIENETLTPGFPLPQISPDCPGKTNNYKDDK